MLEIDVDAQKPASQEKAPQQREDKPVAAKQTEAKQTDAPQPKSESKPAETKSQPKPTPVAAAKPIAGSRGEKREKMSRLRQTISKRLKEAQNTTAMLTTFQEVDMGDVMKARSELQDAFTKKHGVKLGFMSFFVKATSNALTSMPIVNAVIDGNEIVYRDYVDISVAVATPTGLVVPVIRNAESLSFADIERKIIELGDKGKKGSLTMEDMTGGTFSITNG